MACSCWLVYSDTDDGFSNGVEIMHIIRIFAATATVLFGTVYPSVVAASKIGEFRQTPRGRSSSPRHTTLAVQYFNRASREARRGLPCDSKHYDCDKIGLRWPQSQTRPVAAAVACQPIGLGVWLQYVFYCDCSRSPKNLYRAVLFI